MGKRKAKQPPLTQEQLAEYNEVTLYQMEPDEAVIHDGSKRLHNDKHEAFAIARAKGLNRSAAARVAGYTKSSAAMSGSRIEKRPEVTPRISYLLKAAGTSVKTLEEARAAMIAEGGDELLDGATATWLALEFHKNCQLARALKSPREANIALAYIARLHKRMPSDMPFVHEDTNKTARLNGDDRKTTEVSQGNQISERMGDAASHEDSTEEAFGIEAPSELEEADRGK